MTTTITKQLLLDKAKPRYEEVTVPGWGTMGLRSVDQVLLSRRETHAYIEREKGNMRPIEVMRIYKLIDQCMIDRQTPMFDESDVDELARLDAYRLNPLFDAINEFNGETEGNEAGGSSESSES